MQYNYAANSDLAGMVGGGGPTSNNGAMISSSAYGSKDNLTTSGGYDEDEAAANMTSNKNYLTTEELTAIEGNPMVTFKKALENLVTSADWND